MDFRIPVEDRFPSKVVSRSKLAQVINTIKSKLKADELESFKTSCFGHFLDIEEIQWASQIVHQVLLRQLLSPADEAAGRMLFRIGGHKLTFSLKEFNLITGLRYSPLLDVSTLLVEGKDVMVQKLFKGQQRITCNALHEKFIACEESNDKLKLALVYFAEFVLMGREPKLFIDTNWLELVGSLEEFNSFLWGTLSFKRTAESLNSALICRAEKNKQKGKGSDFYNLVGFPLAFQIWAYEAIPALALNFASALEEKYPRMLC